MPGTVFKTYLCFCILASTVAHAGSRTMVMEVDSDEEGIPELAKTGMGHRSADKNANGILDTYESKGTVTIGGTEVRLVPKTDAISLINRRIKETLEREDATGESVATLDLRSVGAAAWPLLAGAYDKAIAAPESRLRAVRAIAWIGNDLAKKGDATIETRHSIAGFLTDVLLQERDPGVQKIAIRALSALGPKAVDPQGRNALNAQFLKQLPTYLNGTSAEKQNAMELLSASFAALSQLEDGGLGSLLSRASQVIEQSRGKRAIGSPINLNQALRASVLASSGGTIRSEGFDLPTGFEKELALKFAAALKGAARSPNALEKAGNSPHSRPSLTTTSSLACEPEETAPVDSETHE